ncbi:CFEM domain-containing protein [Calycina marina]|uniref:CFEM domain-containing protein n=1 Tax=Calycina marina TaxID=1763456 RepID=A0A9P7Z7D2_9HELO|nr:CFEM domain-containing protein [Calycina marina]
MNIVLLRMYHRWSSNAAFGPDDWAIVSAIVVGVPGSFMNVYGITSNGLGTDIWTLWSKTITDLIHNFYTIKLLYFVQVGAIKLAFLLFYLRIFPGHQIRKTICVTILDNTLYTALFVLIGVFQCKPISFYWKRWNGEHVGSCINLNAFAFSNAAISIVLNVVMLTLPLTQIFGLHMHWKKRAGVAMMFTWLDRKRNPPSLCCLANTQNLTWEYWNISLWSTIEINAGIICYCMPNLRFLLIRAFVSLMGSSQNRSMSKAGYWTELNEMPDASSRRAKARTKAEEGGWSVKGGISQTEGFEVPYAPAFACGSKSDLELASIHSSTIHSSTIHPSSGV